MSEKLSIESRLATNGFAPTTPIKRTAHLGCSIADLMPPTPPIVWLAMTTMEGDAVVKLTASEPAEDGQGGHLPDLVGFGIIEDRTHVRWYVEVEDGKPTAIYVQITIPEEPLSLSGEIRIKSVE